jgi:hypothetical protein
MGTKFVNCINKTTQDISQRRAFMNTAMDLYIS